MSEDIEIRERIWRGGFGIEAMRKVRVRMPDVPGMVGMLETYDQVKGRGFAFVVDTLMENMSWDELPVDLARREARRTELHLEGLRQSDHPAVTEWLAMHGISRDAITVDTLKAYHADIDNHIEKALDGEDVPFPGGVS